MFQSPLKTVTEKLKPTQSKSGISSLKFERASDFKKFIGERVIVKLKRSIDGVKYIKGIIIDVGASEILFKTNKIEITVPYSEVQKANLNREIKV